jgi:RNA recognition motif-containing protein
LKNVSETNVVVKGLNKDIIDSQKLDDLFTEAVGKVKYCKVSKTIENEGENYSCKSNGYGFVNFEDKESAEKAVNELNGTELEGSKLIVERYNKDIKREAKFNNLYCRGFDENFTEDQLREAFEGCGELGSVVIMKNEDGTSKKFGFVCFKDSDAAKKAVEMNHNRTLNDGTTLYVAKFEKKQNRWAALKKSLARANLYVRNFDKDVTEEDLKNFFGGDEKVRNVRIMTTDVNREDGIQKESKQFGFVSFNNPKDAAEVIQKANDGLQFNNKQLYVNYYEDKASRRKRLASKKEKPDVNNLMGILDPIMTGDSGDQGSNMMEYFMQIFQQYFKNYSQGQSNYNYNYGNQYGHSYGNYNQHNRRNRNQRSYHNQMSNYGYHNQPAMASYARATRPESHNYPQTASNIQPKYHSTHTPMPETSTMPAPAPAPAPATTTPIASTSHISQPGMPPVQNPPPVNTPSVMYVNSISGVLKSAEFVAMNEEAKRERIGEEIYEQEICYKIHTLETKNI